MSDSGFLRAMDISGSGLRAERARMELVARNIANANTTKMEGGKGPYRRLEAVLESVQSGENAGGVEVRIEEDKSPFVVVHRPGHPDADENGNLLLPNVNTASEMMDLIISSRGYEANLKAIHSYLSAINEVLSIGR